MPSLIRWNPRNEVEVMDPFNTIEQMIDEMWRSWPFRTTRETGAFLRPAMDVIENDKELILRVDLPGLKPEDVNVSVEDHTLTISGRFGDTIEREGERYHYRERRTGQFERSVRLPNTVDPEKAEANFENGVLSITFEKLPQAQPKQITIKASKK